jgi:hypothetical protein
MVSLIFRGLAHDAQSGLAGILGRLTGPVRFEKMLRERFMNQMLRVRREWHLANRTAMHAVDLEQVRGLLRHAPSLRRPRWRSTPVDFKRHHYRRVRRVVMVN